jgi:hypothetical protein
MTRRLEELDRLDGALGLGAAAGPPTTRRPVLGRRVRQKLAVLFALSMFGLVVVLGLVSPNRSSGDQVLADSRPFPAPPADARPDRIRPAVPVTSAGAHKYKETLPDGQPITFDPCRPIHYVFNPVGMPSGGAEELRSAIRAIGDATGLEFEEDGVTSEQVVENRESVQPDRYGTGWAPVLIVWADEAEFPLLGGDVIGVTNSAVFGLPGSPGAERYLTGRVALDRTWFARALADRRSAPLARSVLLHELGHLVGLDHVTDPREIMTESGMEAVELGPGDREGLAVLGSGPCHSDT